MNLACHNLTSPKCTCMLSSGRFRSMACCFKPVAGCQCDSLCYCLSIFEPSRLHRLVFMASGMAAATLTHTPDALAIAPMAAELAWPTPGLVNTGLMLLAASVAAYAGLIKAAQAVSTCLPRT